MSIADTIVPGTAEWLVHYEIWLVTSEWYGGGDWPPRRAVTAGLLMGQAEEPRPDGRPVGPTPLRRPANRSRGGRSRIWELLNGSIPDAYASSCKSIRKENP